MEALKQKVAQLDLDPILVKLTDTTDGEGWSREDAEKAVAEYRKFMYLVGEGMVRGVGTPNVPWGTVDTVWHTHILDTEKYANDCQWLFGQMLHHFPYFGMRGEQDRSNLIDAARDTIRRAIEVFGAIWTPRGLATSVPMTCDGKWCGATFTGGISTSVIGQDKRPTYRM